MQGKCGNGIIIAGRLIKDVDYKEVGANSTPKASFAVAVDRGQGGTIVNVVAWRKLAGIAKNFRKGDNVAVMGVESVNEYNGKTYRDLDADWLAPAGESSIDVTSSISSMISSDPLPWE